MQKKKKKKKKEISIKGKNGKTENYVVMQKKKKKRKNTKAIFLNAQVKDNQPALFINRLHSPYIT